MPGPTAAYFQQVSLVGVKADPDTKADLSSNKGKESCQLADEYVALHWSSNRTTSALTPIWCFVGYGIDAPEQRWNDYKGQPADYRGKILVMLVNDPPRQREEPDLFGGRRR